MTDQKPVAIVGVGAILPDAPDPQSFWQNIRIGWSSIREVPSGRWDPNFYYDPDPNAPDKTYSKIGAWVQGFKLEPQKLGLAIPPKIIAEMEEAQQWSIDACHQALVDYGYPRRQLEPTRVAVILGNLMAGEKHYLTGLRIRLPEFVHALESTPAFQDLPKETQKALVDGMRSRVHAWVPPITEDTLPGELANVIAGRVSNLFNFSGPNFIVDAACATSLAAIQCAIQGLNNDQYDAVLSGGIDRNMGPDGFVKFCKIGALSPDGSRPYADGANGFVMGEGAVVFLLKRLADAEQDGDRIYAVIRGIGGSSDGKGKGITAPNPNGQIRAIERAWKNAGLSPATATLIEGHGTATRVGDVVETGSLNTLFAPFNLPAGKIALGSVKSNVGHLKAAAGAVALLKTIYALHDRILPPSINYERPNPQIDFAHSPFQVNTVTRPWEMGAGLVRRAGISAFGFGGTNFHMVVEEYIPGLLTSTDHHFPVTVSQSRQEAPRISEMPSVATEKSPVPVPKKSAPLPVYGEVRVEAAQPRKRGLLFLSAQTSNELRQAIQNIIAQLKQGATVETPLPSPEESALPERLAMDFADRDDLLKRSEKTLKAMEMDAPNAWQSLAGQGIYRGHGMPGKIAFLFPGQGSQYANMLRDLSEQEPVVKEVFAQADEVMLPILGRTLTSYIYSEEDPASMAAAEEALKDTTITQPAVLTANVALLRLMEQAGFKPDMVAGHSLGEYAALVAAGVLSFPQALEVVSNRGRAMAKVSLDDNGCMAAVSAPLHEIERILKSIDDYVVIANINSPLQSVIGGSTSAINASLAAFDAAGYQAVKIPVSHAFHTRIVAPASQPLRDTIARMDIHLPAIPVVANVTGQVYPESSEGILDILAQQVASPVQFVRTMDTLYSNGARIFVEAGPKRVLTALAVDNLKDHNDVTILATNHPRKGGPASFNEALAGLYAAGVIPLKEGKEIRKGAMPVALVSPQAEKPDLLEANATPGTHVAQTEEIKAFILKEVSERTGYPEDMLELDLDLEGDLGIDTVKQAELFVTMREHFQIPRPENLRLSDYNTLAKVIAFALQGIVSQQVETTLPAPQVNRAEETSPSLSSESRIPNGESLTPNLNSSLSSSVADPRISTLETQASIPLPDESLLSSLNSSQSMIRRQVPIPVLRPRPDLCHATGVRLDAVTRALVVLGRGALGPSLVQALGQRQVDVVTIENNSTDFESQVAALAATAPFEGVYFLPSFDTEPGWETLSALDWQTGLEQYVYHLFTLLRALPNKPFLVCATSMGGLHGYGPGDSGAGLSAGTRGFAKALARERSGKLVKVVDFDLQAEVASVANSLIQETLFDPTEVEISYQNGLRFGISLKEEELQEASAAGLPENSVFLVSGGTGGISGRVVLDLAHASHGVFYLMGRTPLPGKTDPLLARVKHDRDSLRKEWLRTPGEDGSKSAPSLVEAGLARLERAADTLDVIRQVEESGSQVHYLSCDVTDFESVRQAVGKVAQAEGRVDILVHAAGFESSRKLESKTRIEIHQTVDIKATGFFHLIKALEEQHCLPQRVVGFASVAGRFGNVGQTDYSAANDLLARLIATLHLQHPEIRALCLDWGPWAEVGMASRGHIPALMKMAGVDLLPPGGAAPLVRQELISTSHGEIVLAGSLGSEEARQSQSTGLDLEKAGQLLKRNGPGNLLGQLVSFREGDGFDLQVVLDPKKEPFLFDHALNRIPVLPGVMGVEGFIEIGHYVAALFTPDPNLWQVTCLDDVHFMVPVKFYRDQPHTLVWRVQVEPQASGMAARISLESDLARHNHPPEHIQHFTGRILLGTPSEDQAGSASLQPGWNADLALRAEEIYHLYFHGPAFRVLEGVSFSGGVLTGKLNRTRPPLAANLSSGVNAPALVELVMQTAAAWEIGNAGALCLPYLLTRLTIHSPLFTRDPEGVTDTGIFAVVTPHSRPDGVTVFDGHVVDGRGMLYLSIEGYQSSPLPYTAEEHQLQPFRKLLGS